MQQPLALIGTQGTIFSEHEVFRVYDFEIVFMSNLILNRKYSAEYKNVLKRLYKTKILTDKISRHTLFS